LIWLYLRQHHSGKAFFAPTEVELDDQTIVQPDICVVLKHSQAEITEKRIVGAPDWIIEVLSPSTYDYDLDIKRNLYVRHGVVYWAINSADETILTWDEYGRQIFKGNYPVNPSVLPAFCLSVASLLTASR
jgi:Uma2 family endonuclease